MTTIRVKENALFVLSQSRSTEARDLIASTARSSSNPDVQLRAVRYLGAMRTPDSQQTLDDIYRFAVEQTAMSRGQFLELTIVLILVLELVLFFMGIMK